MNYYGGGGETGNDFALIRLRNTGPAPCRLTGPIGLSGVDLTGAADTMNSAEYRDQTNGLCTKRIIPTRWRVTLATGSATVANIDNADPYTEFRRLLTCAGELDSPASIVSR